MRGTGTDTSAPSARRPVAVDLFAGAGGLSLGLEQAGFDVVASVEYDPVHATTHAFNFPLTEVLCDDIGKLPESTLRRSVERGWANHHGDEPWDGEVDLVAGGPPCQGFSWIGKRQVDDARNDLIFHFFRLVNSLRPRYFLMENVPGIASGEHKELLADLIRRFENAGYVVPSPHILNAADYGVPQDRRRFILLGYRADVDPVAHPAPVVRPARPVRSTLRSNVEPLPAGPTVWDAIGDLPDLDQFPALATSDVTPLTRAQQNKMDLAASEYARRLRGLEDDPTDFAYRRKWDPSVLTSSWQTQHTDVSISRFAATEQGSTEKVSRFLRLAEEGLCNTLRAGTGGERGAHTSPRPLHPRNARVLSVREAARLHSFPDWFRLHSTKWNGFRQIGNAVPPIFGRALGRAVIEALGVQPAKPDEVLELTDEHLLYMAMGEATKYAGASHDSIPKSRRRSKPEPRLAEAV
ncbi:DNA cytosine methyltransferase [Protaetiibacter larvae]|uniref:Cytosine-specific methyltransferase n=1 Tax=Protaetiibacter larvae TaxID=2592654 RepID=A0A5C1Y447_9MICO|nr:DNA cytosine methyltransferase [Protaetiibacter larvae]QEO08793.1 DNA cytosine methyltransferase [Protaetiibacter larvae]